MSFVVLMTALPNSEILLVESTPELYIRFHIRIKHLRRRSDSFQSRRL